MKKLINDPRAVVEEMIDGLAASYSSLVRLPGHTVLVRADIPADASARRVAVISGGGSGHEPAHAGYVGRGMLSGAVAGDVFTSPAPDAVLAAIRATAGPAGALLVVKNYTGDRLNFGVAAERARAEGIPVESVFVADDVALAGSADTAGPRGLAGTILVHKVAGALAEKGAPLAEVVVKARGVAERVHTMGVALTPCIVPAAGQAGFTLAENEIELGLGIHGEPGVRRGPLEPADALVDRMLDAILSDLARTRHGRVVLMVNNLGGTPAMELAIVARRALAVLASRKWRVERVYMGTFLSALEMAGVSLSVLPVDADTLKSLDAPTKAPAWPSTVGKPPRHAVSLPPPASETPKRDAPKTPLGIALERAIRSATDALIAAAPRLTGLDQAVGDGDLGVSMERGARAVQDAMATYPLDEPSSALHALGVTLQTSLGGTSGPLYAAFFVRAASRLTSPDSPAAWADAFQAGCDAIAGLGGAQRGDRTMLDALLPAAEAFQAAVTAGSPTTTALHLAADAAEAGAQATAGMRARRGRSSYLGERVVGHPDPGAVAAAIWLAAIK